MPIFIYKNPETGEVKEIIQSVNDNHSYSENGVKFERQFTIPNMSTDTRIDPWDSSSFIKATNKPGTIGEIMDRSAELSEKRAGGSLDPIKEQYYESYAERRGGKEHPDKVIKKAQDKLSQMGVNVEV
jgi:hypothetical protein